MTSTIQVRVDDFMSCKTMKIRHSDTTRKI